MDNEAWVDRNGSMNSRKCGPSLDFLEDIYNAQQQLRA